jgi:ABC-2 type transport system permease protein
MALHDLGYRHWEGSHRGIWRRRWIIAAHGLKAVVGNRWMRYVLTGAWGIALVQASLLFCIGQLLVADSVIVQWSASLPNAMVQAIVRGLAIWLEQHPEISVRTAQNLVFYHFSRIYLTLGLLSVTLAIPHLITRDLSSNAIIIYASKAVNRMDYLAGKLGILLGLLTLTWLGPMMAAWVLGNLLAPDWHFFWHARIPLLNSLLFIGCAMLFVGLLGLAASAISAKEKVAVGFWLLLWLVGNAFAPAGEHRQPWLQHLSFHHNLEQIAEAVYQPKAELERARVSIPLLGDFLQQLPNRRLRDGQPPRTRPAGLALGVLALGSVVFLLRRTRTE